MGGPRAGATEQFKSALGNHNAVNMRAYRRSDGGHAPEAAQGSYTCHR